MQTNMRVILIFSFMLVSIHLKAQMDSLVLLSSHFLDINYNQQLKEQENQRFTEVFAAELAKPEALSKSFDALGNISVQSPKDKNFKIYTWFLLNKDGYHAYGLFQAIEKKSKNPIVSVLENNEDIRNAESRTLNSKTWLGYVYYDLIPFKIKSKKYYALLGFNPGNGLSHSKVIEIVQVNSNGTPKFGAPVFDKDRGTANRIILQYDAQAKVTLRYNESKKMIIFDHLSPKRPELADQFEFYVPDLSYDAFLLNNKKWDYKPDVDARNLTEDGGNLGARLVIDGVNDQNTLEKKIEDKKKKKKKDVEPE